MKYKSFIYKKRELNVVVLSKESGGGENIQKNQEF
jgi:hypothetical protein